MWTWWALRSNGCVRKCSPGGHLNKEWVCFAPSAEAQLSALFFLGREQNTVQLSGSFPPWAKRTISLLQLYIWQHDISGKITTRNGSEQLSESVASLSLKGCNKKELFIHLICLPDEWCKHTFSHAGAGHTQTDDHSRSRAAHSAILWLLPAFLSPTIRLQADRGVELSHCVKRLCQNVLPIKMHRQPQLKPVTSH